MASNFSSEQDRYELRRARRAQRMGLTGPILLVALGVMFLVGQFVPHWGVGRTWPVILIIIGLARLFESVLAARSTPPR
ncbi:MAG TPA: DUF5668 domain-containing protein [Terriglobia bacterium]|nr:DUF5668 domain-containing protein [Terriglobia bacterium]